MKTKLTKITKDEIVRLIKGHVKLALVMSETLNQNLTTHIAVKTTAIIHAEAIEKID